jgi:hypothetical protein
MLANFFGKSNPANYIIIFVLFVCYSTAAFFLGFSQVKEGLWLASVLGLFLLLFFFFNFILAKNKLTLYNTYGFLFFILLFGIFPFTIFDRYELIVNVILLIMLRRVYSLRTPKAVVKKMFDSGFWLAILFILEPFTLIFGLLMYVSIALFQKLTFRSALIPVVGFLVPLMCYFSYCFYVDDVDRFLHLFAWYTDYDFGFYTSEKVRIPLLFVGLITLLSIIFKTPKVFLISGNYRKFWILTIFNLLVSIGFVAITKDRNGAELMTTFFPVAVILTNGIESFSKSFFQDVVLGIFAVIPIVLFII